MFKFPFTTKNKLSYNLALLAVDFKDKKKDNKGR